MVRAGHLWVQMLPMNRDVGANDQLSPSVASSVG